MNNDELAKSFYDRYKNYVKPTDEQKSFLALYDNQNKTEEEDKLFLLLLRKFKAKEKARKANKDLQNLLNKEEREKAEKQRKLHARKLIVLGGAVLALSKTDNTTKSLIKSLIDKKMIEDKDLHLFDDELLPVDPQQNVQQLYTQGN